MEIIPCRFDCGSGQAVIMGDRPLEMGKWHTVRLERSRSNGTMTVYSDNRRQVSSHNGFSPGRLQGLDLRSSLHLGGVSNFTSAVKQQVGVGQGFVGE